MTTIHVSLNQQHISGGIRTSTCGCPIARAINDVPGCSDAEVGILVADARILGVKMGTSLPPIALTFRTDFDDGKHVAPIEFDLEFSPL